jgi:hypothetical protein
MPVGGIIACATTKAPFNGGKATAQAGHQRPIKKRSPRQYLFKCNGIMALNQSFHATL